MKSKSLDKLNGLYVIPFGGCSIGMSMYAYACDGEYILVDMGIGFHDDVNRTILVPDPTLLIEIKNKIKAVVLTHMHEDHIGAISYIWPMLNSPPIYAMPLVCEMLKEKFVDFQLSNVPLIRVNPYKSVKIGKFVIEYIPVAHSTPEACSLYIKTSYGNVVHSGDWRFDDEPVLGFSTKEEDFKRIGDKGVLAFLCDSTNAHKEGSISSEKAVRENLIKLVGDLKGHGVVITCFASNIARLESCYLAAKENGRQMAIMGRSLRRIEKIARASGYLKGIPPFLSDKQAANLDKKDVLMVCTGSQGETNAALSKIAYGLRGTIFKLGDGDKVIFSSRTIPGNEKPVLALQGALISRGIDIITDEKVNIHASGHASSSEIKKMYELLRPNVVIPVHGDVSNLYIHSDFAKECGIKHSFPSHEGAVIRLDENNSEIEQTLEIKKMMVDGIQLVPLDGNIKKERANLLESGVVVASLALDKKKKTLKCDNFSFVGVFEKDEGEEKENISSDISASISLICDGNSDIFNNYKQIEKEATKIIENALAEERGIKPTVIVHIIGK